MIHIPRLDLNDAYILLNGAKKKANEIGIPMCIAIADDSGNLIAFEKMDTAKIHSISIAQDKAFTAGAARKATHEYNANNIPGELTFGIHTECGGRLSTVGGGYPVFYDEQCIGGIGASGGTPQEDMEVSKAAIDYFFENKE